MVTPASPRRRDHRGREGLRPHRSFGGAVELYPGAEVRTDAGLRDYIRRTVDSYYHPVGTCRMGSDDAAVVDPELRVLGRGGRFWV